MIVDTITGQIQNALRAGDETRLSTLRMLSSALNYEFIAKQHKLNSDEELGVVAKEIKKRKDAIEAYEKAGAKDRADAEEAEMNILLEYMPKQLSDEELAGVVDDVIAQTGASGKQDMGKVIGAVKAKVGLGADGARIAKVVSAKLT